MPANPVKTAAIVNRGTEMASPRPYDRGDWPRPRRRGSQRLFVAEYTDEGGGKLPPRTGSDDVVLEPTG